MKFTRALRRSATIRQGLTVASSLGVACALSGCNDGIGLPDTRDGEAGDGGGAPDVTAIAPAAAAAPAPAGVATFDGINLVTGPGRSKHFEAVASHLTLGGTMFGYVDIDGDLEKLAGTIQQVLGKLPREGMPPHIAKLDLVVVLGELGLDRVEALGASSFKNGDIYHNRAFIYVPEGRKGLLKIFGGESGPFVAKSLAPADADLVVEQTLNIRAVYDVVSAMVMRFGGEEASREFQSKMGEANPQLGLSMAEILGRVETRLTAVGRVHPDKPLEIPDAPVEIPSFDFLIAFDDLGWLYEKITSKLKQEMPAEMFVKGEGFEKVALPPVPSGEMAVMQPVVYHDLASKRVFVASTQGFLDECLSGKTRLADSAEFKIATAGLPEEGNGLTFISPKLLKAGRGIYESATGAARGATGQQETLLLSMLATVFPSSDAGQAKVVVNQDDGIFISSNSSASMKEGLIMSGATTMATFLFGVRSSSSSNMVPGLLDAREHAHELTVPRERPEAQVPAPPVAPAPAVIPE